MILLTKLKGIFNVHNFCQIEEWSHEFYLCGNAKALARNQVIKNSVFPVWWTFVQQLQSRATLIGGVGINGGSGVASPTNLPEIEPKRPSVLFYIMHRKGDSPVLISSPILKSFRLPCLLVYSLPQWPSNHDETTKFYRLQSLAPLDKKHLPG